MAKYNYRWSPEKQRAIAEFELIKYLQKIVEPYSPFYQKMFKESNVNVKKIRTIEDFQSLPVISKKEHMVDPASFILTPYEPNWWECKYQTKPLPFGSQFRYWLRSLNKTYFRSIFGREPMPDSERSITEAANDWLPVHFHSTGSSNEPALIAYTKRDLTVVIPEIVAQIYSTGFRANWEVFNMMPAAPSINFFQNVWSPLFVGGGTFFTCGEEMTSIDKQIAIANSITFEVFLGSPSYLAFWLKKALLKLEQKEIEPITSIKLCILSGESLTPELKAQLKNDFAKLGSQPKLLESYSNNRLKVSFTECSEGSGIHLNPRYFYWEVLDTETLEPVKEGEKGYLCFSHINWRGTSFIRYNTGDVVEGLIWDKCPQCGLTLPTIIGYIIRDKEEFFTVKKKTFSKIALEQSLWGIEGLALFQVEIRKGRAKVYAYVEGDSSEKIKKEIVEILQSEVGVKAEIILETIDEVQERLFSRGILKAEWLIVE